jgi:hypothetical protein
MIGRAIRATLLDQSVYREAAADETDTSGAALVVIITMIAATVGNFFTGMGFFARSFSYLIVLPVMQVLSFALAVAVVSKAAQSVAGVEVSFWKLFRALAYAQAIGVVGIIPPLAFLAGLWRLVTTVAAIRGVLGCDTGKAIILLILGFVVTFAAGLLTLMLIGRF